MKLHELFKRSVTRDIPPVVYFHEDSPERLAAEVEEYIVTGGFEEGTPQHDRVPTGIHEQYVRLMRAIARDIEAGRADKPAAWISGFYGSGKSSFAKLLGLALDQRTLPDGRDLGDALVARDGSPLAAELVDAWQALRQPIDPMAVVFDIGSVARDREHIHAAVVRQVARRLDYCSDDVVARFELDLWRDGRWDDFEAVCAEEGVDWSTAKEAFLAAATFSRLMHRLLPDTYSEPHTWSATHKGGRPANLSVSEATRAIADMLEHRGEGRHLFLVVDEVSQYIHQDHERMLSLQSFVSDLGDRLDGRVWLLVTGQEKLDDAGNTVLGKMKDRFPPRLRVHLSPANIRDVVHRRLLEKKGAVRAALIERFEAHRHDLARFAYAAEHITPDDFVATYPLLPGQIDLLLRITSAIRSRSSRAQGDNQAIRGLLQLLGELFRRGLADEPMGRLVALDDIYDVQATALDSDVQATFGRLRAHCADLSDRELGQRALRVAKAVALLELIQDTEPTTADLVARTLYDRLDRGAQVDAIEAALLHLKQHNLLAYSDKHGFKIQSTAGEDWSKERDDLPVGRSQVREKVAGCLKRLTATIPLPELAGRKLPWRVLFSDEQHHRDHPLKSERDKAAVVADLRFVDAHDREQWLRDSDSTALRNRFLWVVGGTEAVYEAGRRLARSQKMIARYRPRRESLTHDQRRLLLEEEAREEGLLKALDEVVRRAFLDGRLYFRGQEVEPAEIRGTLGDVLHEMARRFANHIFPHILSVRVSQSDLERLFADRDPAALPRLFGEHDGPLWLYEQDGGQLVFTCQGTVPRRLLDTIKESGGLQGSELLDRFGGPPNGFPASVVKAGLVGLLRGGHIRVSPSSGAAITSVTDAGAKQVMLKDRELRGATLLPKGEDVIGRRTRARLCKLFATHMNTRVERNDTAIANAIVDRFPQQRRDLEDLVGVLERMGPAVTVPSTLTDLAVALRACIDTARRTEAVVLEAKKRLPELSDGLQLRRTLTGELFRDGEPREDRVQQVSHLGWVSATHVPQLEAAAALDGEEAEHARALREHLGETKPWAYADVATEHADALVAAYTAARQALIDQHTRRTESARSQLKQRPGFVKVSAEAQRTVLRPLATAMLDTTAQATTPTLVQLRDGFEGRLSRAVARAHALLDEAVAALDEERITPVSIGLAHRELSTPEDVDAACDELRERLLQALSHADRIRLV